MKTIVLGVGNPILRDDGVGIYVVRELKKHVSDPNVTMDEAFTSGMNLLDMIRGYDRAILIDAVKTNGNAGEVKRFLLNDLSKVHSCNLHDVSLLEAVKLAEKLGGDTVPHEIVVVGVLVEETPSMFGEGLSPAVASAVPKAVDMTLSELGRIHEGIG
jgi:hydrogenase maturation protease